MRLRSLLEPGPLYSVKKVIFIVLLSLATVLSIVVATHFFYTYVKKTRATHKKYVICGIIQAAPSASLPTVYLEQVLDLSIDKPVNLSEFNLEEAHKRLLSTHIISEAVVKKYKPNIIYLEYTLREPMAFLGDYSNTALDKEGFFFPYAPFYLPNSLPTIYVGEGAAEAPWGSKMEEGLNDLLADLLSHLEDKPIERIDLSRAFSPSIGRREIVIIFKEGNRIRLTPERYRNELHDFYLLEKEILTDKSSGWTVDLRIPEIAFLQFHSI